MSFGRPKKYLYTKELLFSLAHCARLLFRALWGLFTAERAERIQAGFGPDTAIFCIECCLENTNKGTTTRHI